eukprot:5554817-Amphidinium_carterae.1
MKPAVCAACATLQQLLKRNHMALTPPEEEPEPEGPTVSVALCGQGTQTQRLPVSLPSNLFTA